MKAMRPITRTLGAIGIAVLWTVCVAQAGTKSPAIRLVNSMVGTCGYVVEVMIDPATSSVSIVDTLHQEQGVAPPRIELLEKSVLLRYSKADKRMRSTGAFVGWCSPCVPNQQPPFFRLRIHWIRNGVVMGRRDERHESEEVVMEFKKFR